MSWELLRISIFADVFAMAALVSIMVYIYMKEYVYVKEKIVWGVSS